MNYNLLLYRCVCVWCCSGVWAQHSGPLQIGTPGATGALLPQSGGSTGPHHHLSYGPLPGQLPQWLGSCCFNEVGCRLMFQISKRHYSLLCHVLVKLSINCRYQFSFHQKMHHYIVGHWGLRNEKYLIKNHQQEGSTVCNIFLFNGIWIPLDL